MAPMLTIDGTFGEGGGQILRTSLGLSLVTGRPFVIERIRGGRSKPGLLRQHLCGVRAAVEISGADVEGDALGSGRLVFRPGAVQPGEYHCSVGSAGSALLVLQAILPGLMLADGPSRIVLEGGTHNPWAPPFPFVTASFAPVLKRMGVGLELTLERPGFYPAGGGRMIANITPTRRLKPIKLRHQKITGARAIATVANVSDTVAERQLSVLRRKLRELSPELRIERLEGAMSPGNCVRVEVDHGVDTACFVAFGERRKRPEKVAQAAARATRDWMRRKVPVEEHLADQLLIPMALAGEGSFFTGPPSSHTTTNVHTIGQFLDVRFDINALDDDAWVVAVSRQGPPRTRPESSSGASTRCRDGRSAPRPT